MGKATLPTDGTDGRNRYKLPDDRWEQIEKILKALGFEAVNIRAFTVRYAVGEALSVTVEQYVEHPEGHTAVLNDIGERKWVERVFEEAAP